MMENARTAITVETTVNAPVEKVWSSWNEPQHIMQWCQASPEWHAPHAENDLRTGGKFVTTMAARDGSISFDFGGTYSLVEDKKRIEYTMEDGRTVKINFSSDGNTTRVVETFEAEETNPVEMQRGGWQAILESFKTYTDSL